MKWALLSDIHANLQAMDACMAHARSQGAQRFALLGDLVGYGADPGAVVDQAMAMAEQGALLVKGNHDDMAVAPPESNRTVGDASAAWTHDRLSVSQRRFLAALPMTCRDGSMLMVHASVDAPHRWRYVYDQQVATLSLDAASELPEVRYVFGGHVHFQTLYYRGASAGLMKFSPTPGVPVPVARHRLWLATIGSVGQPRDGNPLAMYAMMDTAKSQLTFHRVAYDHAAAAAAILRTDLPAFFADRLELGR